MAGTELNDICILFDTTAASWGGGNQFLRSLASELTHMGCTVTRRPTRTTRAVLLNSYLYGRGKALHPRQVAQLRQTGKMTLTGRVFPQNVQLRRQRKGPVLIHRVDGVPELVRGHRSRADEVQPSVNRLTDHTVFQSEFCRTSFIENCRFTPASSNIITNAVDPALFYPAEAPDTPSGTLRLTALSWSDNIRKGFPTLAELSRLPGVELTFVGRWCPEVDPDEVQLAGVQDSKGVGDILRSSHAMVHAAWGEPCSNAIVEAMACGLPILYRDSGGNRELAQDYGVALGDNVALGVEALRQQYQALRKKVLKDRFRFLINRAAREYLDVFQEVIVRHESGNNA